MSIKISPEEFFSYVKRDGIKFFRQDALAYDIPDNLKKAIVSWSIATDELEAMVITYGLDHSISWSTDELYYKETPNGC